MRKSPFSSISVIRETQKFEHARIYRDSAQLFADGHKFFSEKLQGNVPVEAYFDSLVRTLLLDKEFLKANPQYAQLAGKRKKTIKS